MRRCGFALSEIQLVKYVQEWLHAGALRTGVLAALHAAAQPALSQLNQLCNFAVQLPFTTLTCPHFVQKKLR